MNFRQLGKLSLLVSITTIMTACQTSPKPSGQPRTQASSNIWEALSMDPVSIGAAVNGARVILANYDQKLGRADKTRRGFNLASIAAVTYTSVGAALNVHNHNLIASTAMSAILPQVEENMQSHGSPETLGSAMTKTQCIVQAGNLALAPDTLRAAELIRRVAKKAPASSFNEAKSALFAYERVKNHIVSGYGQVYIDYAANRTPAQLDKGALSTALSNLASTEEDVKDEGSQGLISNVKKMTSAMDVARVSNFISDAPLITMRNLTLVEQDLSPQIAVLNTAANATIEAIGNCLTTS